MENKQFQPTYAAFGIGWSFNFSRGQIDTLIAISARTEMGFPYGFPGGKESPEDEKNPLNTIKREWMEEVGFPVFALLNKFYIKKRRNDDGSGESFCNHFYFFQGEDGERMRPTPRTKDTIKEVKWVSLLEAEKLKLRYSQRGALIEFCYVLEETMKEETEIALRGLSYKMFFRPSTINGEITVKPQHIKNIGYLIPRDVLPVLPRGF